jgi:hypothetical protein
MPKWTGGALHRFVDPYEYLVFTRYNGDWKACSSALYHLGYGSRYSDGQSTETGDERVKRIALEAAHAVRTSTNWPDTVARQAIRLAQERVPQKVTEAVLAHACLWSPEQLQRVNAYVTAAYKAVNSASA